LWRHTDGRKHFARGRGDRRSVHQSRAISEPDSRSWPHTCGAQHYLFATPHQNAHLNAHQRTSDDSGVCLSRTIAILGGTGPAGTGLAIRWARAGESVIIGSRSDERAREAAAKISQRAGPGAKVTGDTNANACSAADLLALTVPFEGQAALLKEL